MAQVASSLALFMLAGLCEIGGGYLVWQWWRNEAHWGVGALGVLALCLYGMIPTYQPADFGRVGLCLAGVAVIMYWPR
jgi:small multidrug resistance family-3 protein